MPFVTATRLNARLKQVSATLRSDSYTAATKESAYKLFDRFVEVYEPKYPKAAECLKKDREKMLTFYEFPAESWCHIRSTNPIESTFATVRLRTNKTKSCGNANATLLMVFKLTESVAKGWNKLRGYQLLTDVIDIQWKFVDGIKQKADAA